MIFTIVDDTNDEDSTVKGGPGKSARRRCIGMATSKDVQGPYKPSDKPLICDSTNNNYIGINYSQDITPNICHLFYKNITKVSVELTVQRVDCKDDATLVNTPQALLTKSTKNGEELGAATVVKIPVMAIPQRDIPDEETGTESDFQQMFPKGNQVDGTPGEDAGFTDVYALFYSAGKSRIEYATCEYKFHSYPATICLPKP